MLFSYWLQLEAILRGLEQRLSKQLHDNREHLSDVIVSGSAASSRGSGGPSIVLMPEEDSTCATCGREFDPFRLAHRIPPCLHDGIPNRSQRRSACTLGTFTCFACNFARLTPASLPK